MSSISPLTSGTYVPDTTGAAKAAQTSQPAPTPVKTSGTDSDGDHDGDKGGKGGLNVTA